MSDNAIAKENYLNRMVEIHHVDILVQLVLDNHTDLGIMLTLLNI